MIDDKPRIFDDDGNEINPNLIPKPDLCVSCRKDTLGGWEAEMLCNLNRADQQGEEVFKCYAYEPKEKKADSDE